MPQKFSWTYMFKHKQVDVNKWFRKLQAFVGYIVFCCCCFCSSERQRSVSRDEWFYSCRQQELSWKKISLHVFVLVCVSVSRVAAPGGICFYFLRYLEQLPLRPKNLQRTSCCRKMLAFSMAAPQRLFLTLICTSRTSLLTKNSD